MTFICDHCGCLTYRHVTDDIFRCNGCNHQVDSLVASSPTPPLSDESSLPIDEEHDGKHDHAHVGRGGAEGESQQEPLFTYPRSPAWS